jgi:tetratricopeptide (TPR) repeat protein
MRHRSLLLFFLLFTLVASPFLRAQESPESLSEGEREGDESGETSTAGEVAAPVAPPRFFDALKQGQLEAYKKDYRIERSDLAVAALIHRAETALERGDSADALALAESAKKLSPDTPSVYFSLADFHWKAGDPLAAIRYRIQGMRRVFGDFPSLLSWIGIFGLALLFAIALSLLTFAAYSVAVPGRLWVHRIVELSKGRLHPVAAGLLLAAVLSLPLILRIPPFGYLAIFFLFFWGVYRRAERQIVVCFLIVTSLASAWLLPYLTTFLLVQESPLLQRMIQNAQKEAPLVPFVSDTDDWRADVFQAAYHQQRGNDLEAQALYDAAFSKRPESTLILTNLGNLKYATHEYTQALAYYQQAVENAGDPTALLYNTSQTYRETLDFNEGEKKYREAMASDGAQAERYTQEAVIYPSHPLVEARFASSELWREVLQQVKIKEADATLWQAWAGGMSIRRAPIVIGAVAVVFFVVSFLFKRSVSAAFCALCRKPVCDRCWEHVLEESVCKTCAERFKSLSQRDDLTLLGRWKQVTPQDYPFFVLPGLAQMAKQKTWIGFFLCFLFYLLLGYELIGESLVSATRGFPSSGGLLLPLGLLIVYAASIFHLMGGRIKRAFKKQVRSQYRSQ